MKAFAKSSAESYFMRITVPPVSAVRESTGLSQSQFAELLGVSVRTRRTGNKVVEPHRALRVRCSVLWRRILESRGKSYSGVTGVLAHASFGEQFSCSLN